ncbi:TetR-like C-terminal domain-containing protein [Kitasatospora sp. GAS204B]|uniref:TetR-like C-terminal domain-containing protein n=1 Tax=unclassified Kitasatospora TaxID=2633591 RepID=UPI002474F2CD|nr:TetR-like C-terminal domain-containing protein [Kitasatospora sp. GAS204B]MDH6122055.1 AcrR family transcriptional regulator [Kitasatospora sp. GAS204B]
MPRAGLTPDLVVDHALALIDTDGPEALTLAAVALRAKVAAPSLYKHVPGGLGGLRRLVGIRVTTDLAATLDAAITGLTGDAAIAALLRAYHGYATEYPNRYAALPQSPATSDEQQTGASGALIGAVFKVLQGYGIADSEAVHAARTVRAVLHGFASLVIGGAFQLSEDLTVTQERLIALLTSGLREWPRPV